MKPLAVQKVLGLLLMLFSLSMLPPVLVSLIYQDGAALPFLSAFVLTLALIYPIRHSRLRGRALFVAVFLAVFGLATVLTLVEAAVTFTFVCVLFGSLITAAGRRDELARPGVVVEPVEQGGHPAGNGGAAAGTELRHPGEVRDRQDAGDDLRVRKGVRAAVLPNVMDFARVPAPGDGVVLHRSS